MGSATYKNLGGGQVTTDKYTVYILYTGAATGFWFEMGTSDKISYMNSSQVLYCNGVAKISVRGGTLGTNVLIKDLKNFEKLIKNLHENLKTLRNSSKIKVNRI